MKTYCRRMDISGENFIRKYIAAFIYDKLENGNMPSIFAYYGSISKNEARRRLENSPEFVASVIDQIAYEMSWHLKTRTVREHIYMVVPEEKLVKNVDIVDGMSGKIRTLGLEKMIMQLYEVLAKEAADELWTASRSRSCISLSVRLRFRRSSSFCFLKAEILSKSGFCMILIMSFNGKSNSRKKRICCRVCNACSSYRR